MRIIIERLRPTSTDYLPILAGIQPAKLCWETAILFLAYRSAMDLNHQLHQ